MDFTRHDLSGIQETIRRHRDRMAQLLDDVLNLCTERIHTGDVALGPPGGPPRGIPR